MENLEVAADPVRAHPAAVEVELAQPVIGNLYCAVHGRVISPDFTPNPFLDYWEGLQIRPAAPGYIITYIYNKEVLLENNLEWSGSLLIWKWLWQKFLKKYFEIVCDGSID